MLRITTLFHPVKIFVTPYCMVIMWPLSLGDLQQSKVLVLHPRPRVTLLLHHNPYPQPVVYWHPISWSLIPHPPKVNNSTPPLQLGPHPTPREFNMPVQGGGGIFRNYEPRLRGWAYCPTLGPVVWFADTGLCDSHPNYPGTQWCSIQWGGGPSLQCTCTRHM